MATGRIGVTPTLGTRWSKAPAGGTTSLSGLDDNSVALVYSVGYEQVYRNGVLLSRGNDYTATTGNSITLIDATIAGDIIEVFANELVPLTDAISKGQFTAKGALLSATAASTPAVLTVGSNDQVLTADSSTATGLKWATPVSGSMTSIATGSLSGSTTTISSISGSYKSLRFDIRGLSISTGADIRFRINGVSTSSYAYLTLQFTDLVSSSAGDSGIRITGQAGLTSAGTSNSWTIQMPNYTDTSSFKIVNYNGAVTDTNYSFIHCFGSGCYNSTSAITSVSIVTSGGTFDAGTYELFGVN